MQRNARWVCVSRLQHLRAYAWKRVKYLVHKSSIFPNNQQKPCLLTHITIILKRQKPVYARLGACAGFPCAFLAQKQQLSHMNELMKKTEQRGASRYIRFARSGVSNLPSIAFIEAEVSAAAGFPLRPAQWQTIWQQPSIFNGFIIGWECFSCRSYDGGATPLAIKQTGDNSHRVLLY